MDNMLSRNASLLVILAGILLGFFLQEVGLFLNPYISYLLMLLMFFSSLGFDPKKILGSLRNPKLFLLSMLIVFALTPTLSLSLRFFNFITFAGVLLIFSTPPAVAGSFWARHLKGDLELALLIITAGSFLSILTLPSTMFLAVGAVIQIDVTSMILDLLKLLFLPTCVAVLFQKRFPKTMKALVGYRSEISLTLVFLLIWGSIAGGAQYIENVLELGVLTAAIFLLLVLTFALSYFLTRKIGVAQAITMGIVTTQRNGTLAIVVGTTIFGPKILSPIISSFFAQALLIILMQLISNYHARENHFAN